MSYEAHICRIATRPHLNSKYTKIQIGTVFCSDVIVGLDVHNNDLGIYFPPDGQLSEEFCIKNKLLRKHPQTGEPLGGYLEDNRRVRAIKICEIQSLGLWMPISVLADYTDISKLKENDTITTLNGVEICKKYVTPQTLRHISNRESNKARKHKVAKITFPKHYDTSQWKFCRNIPEPGAFCIITEKLHGTSGRTGNVLVTNKFELQIPERIKRLSITNKIINKIRDSKKATKFVNKVQNFLDSKEYHIVTGTRNVNLRTMDEMESTNRGFYGSNGFRWEIIKPWAQRLHKDEIVYYEIVGFAGDSPIQKGGPVSDKNLIRKYGSGNTIFSYGCEPKQNEMYVYRITSVDPDTQQVYEYSWTQVQKRARELGVKVVPELDRFIYDGNLEALEERIQSFVNGDSTLDNRHLREGVCIRFEQEKGIDVTKAKSYEFFVVEGMIKSDDNYVDMEEGE